MCICPPYRDQLLAAFECRLVLVVILTSVATVGYLDQLRMVTWRFRFTCVIGVGVLLSWVLGYIYIYILCLYLRAQVFMLS